MVADLAPARGRLLVATTDLEDPNFDGTVVLLVEHDAEGTVGVVLNRPSELPIGEVMAAPPGGRLVGWESVASPPAVVFVGGPVRPDAVMVLAAVPEVADPDLYEPVVGDVGVLRLGEGPIPAVGRIDALRLFAGYAGWGPDQLAGEIADGAWYVVDADEADCTATDPAGLWARVLRRQGGVFTTVTANPVLN